MVKSNPDIAKPVTVLVVPVTDLLILIVKVVVVEPYSMKNNVGLHVKKVLIHITNPILVEIVMLDVLLVLMKLTEDVLLVTIHMFFSTILVYNVLNVNNNKDTSVTTLNIPVKNVTTTV
jgi:hypothetical protein